MAVRTMTQGKLEVLQFIEDFYAAHGYSPTLREILEGIGHGSTSSIAYAMESLAEDGFLTKGVEGQARTQVPTWKPKPAIGSPTDEDDLYDYP